MNIIRKWLSIPTGEKQVEAVKLWKVRWESVNHLVSSGFAYTEMRFEAFTSREDADEFIAALNNALRILKSPSANIVLSEESK